MRKGVFDMVGSEVGVVRERVDEGEMGRGDVRVGVWREVLRVVGDVRVEEVGGVDVGGKEEGMLLGRWIVWDL